MNSICIFLFFKDKKIIRRRKMNYKNIILLCLIMGIFIPAVVNGHAIRKSRVRREEEEGTNTTIVSTTKMEAQNTTVTPSPSPSPSPLPTTTIAGITTKIDGRISKTEMPIGAVKLESTKADHDATLNGLEGGGTTTSTKPRAHGEQKRAKSIADNSTSSQQLNWPNTPEVWSLVTMKSVPRVRQENKTHEELIEVANDIETNAVNETESEPESGISKFFPSYSEKTLLNWQRIANYKELMQTEGTKDLNAQDNLDKLNTTQNLHGTDKLVETETAVQQRDHLNQTDKLDKGDKLEDSINKLTKVDETTPITVTSARNQTNKFNETEQAPAAQINKTVEDNLLQADNYTEFQLKNKANATAGQLESSDNFIHADKLSPPNKAKLANSLNQIDKTEQAETPPNVDKLQRLDKLNQTRNASNKLKNYESNNLSDNANQIAEIITTTTATATKATKIVNKNNNNNNPIYKNGKKNNYSLEVLEDNQNFARKPNEKRITLPAKADNLDNFKINGEHTKNNESEGHKTVATIHELQDKINTTTTTTTTTTPATTTTTTTTTAAAAAAQNQNKSSNEMESNFATTTTKTKTTTTTERDAFDAAAAAASNANAVVAQFDVSSPTTATTTTASTLEATAASTTRAQQIGPTFGPVTNETRTETRTRIPLITPTPTSTSTSTTQFGENITETEKKTETIEEKATQTTTTTTLKNLIEATSHATTPTLTPTPTSTPTFNELKIRISDSLTTTTATTTETAVLPLATTTVAKNNNNNVEGLISKEEFAEKSNGKSSIEANRQQEEAAKTEEGEGREEQESTTTTQRTLTAAGEEEEGVVIGAAVVVGGATSEPRNSLDENSDADASPTSRIEPGADAEIEIEATTIQPKITTTITTTTTEAAATATAEAAEAEAEAVKPATTTEATNKMNDSVSSSTEGVEGAMISSTSTESSNWDMNMPTNAFEMSTEPATTTTTTTTVALPAATTTQTPTANEGFMEGFTTPAPTTMMTTATTMMTTTTTMMPLDGINRMPSSGTDMNVIIAIIVSVIGVIALVLIVAFLYLIRKRQSQMFYAQRCRPVSLDAYSLDNVSVLGSARRKGHSAAAAAAAAMRASKRSYANSAFDDPTLRRNMLSAGELAKFANSRVSIFEEFRDIPQIIAHASEVPAGCEDKNRYANVVPLPETRVALRQLNNDEKTEYINANFVRGPKDTTNYYIACQAPLESTIADFWRMIWEQQSRVIIQATDLTENGVEKCAEYIPPSVTLDNHATYGDYQVTLKNREVKDKYAISMLSLRHNATKASRELTHYWYKWPETGVPGEEAPIIAMLVEARSSLKTYAIEQCNESMATLSSKQSENSDNSAITGETTSTVSTSSNVVAEAEPEGEENNAKMDKIKLAARHQGPLTVHCSPGTGRTGTIIACDMAIRSLETPKRSVDIPQIVYCVRRGRASAIQTKDQYEFIYKVANMYATKITHLSNEN